MNRRHAHPLMVSSPSVRLPLTLCVLAYGPHSDLAERFLSSLYETVDPRLFRLRAGLNEVEDATMKLFKDYTRRFDNIRLFVEPRNVFKLPMMRRMFHQPPIRTQWTIWCDDDTHFSRSDWFQRLVFRMVQEPEVEMWGSIYNLWRRDRYIQNWIKDASWYRGLPLSRGTDPDGNNAIEFRFVTGGFWAVKTSLIRQLDWPDPRLVHLSDDYLLGEAMRQNGRRIENFAYGICVNDSPRRNAAVCSLHELHG
jgi:GT2 family glycosyltransferase